MNSVRLCVVGAGYFAGFAHGPVLRLLHRRRPEVVLAAVADLDEGRAEKFAAEFGFAKYYGDAERMLELERPDGVAVLTQVGATARVGSAILRAGYPVLLEKPPGRNRAEIDELIAASRDSGRYAMVAFNRRYSPLLKLLTDFLRDEVQEPLEHLRCDFYRNERLDDDFSTTAIHGIDALRHLSGGRYDTVNFQYQQLDRERPARNIYLACRFDNRVCGLLSFCPSTGAAFERFTLATRHWTLVAETVIPGGGSDRPGRILAYRDSALTRTLGVTPDISGIEELELAGYYGENAAFAERLRHGFPQFDDLAASRDAVEIADAMRRTLPEWRRQPIREE